jgi:transcriptional regulator with XRE-family HTH domain
MTDGTQSVKPDSGGAIAQHPERLRWRRTAAGLGLNEAARRAKVSKAHLSMLERGIHGASPAVLRRIAKVYRCRIADLMPDEPGKRAA